MRYVYNRKLRSVIAQLGVGILPLAVETGRWKSTPLEDRKCELCTQRAIEDEKDFVVKFIFWNEKSFSGKYNPLYQIMIL